MRSAFYRYFICALISLSVMGCQQNYYLIEEAYSQGNHLQTVRLINRFHDRFPTQIETFLSHSEKRLQDKLRQNAQDKFSHSLFNGLCYTQALLPELSQLALHYPDRQFQGLHTTLTRIQATKRPSFLATERRLGKQALDNQRYFTAIARFKRYLNIEDSTDVTADLNQALSHAKLPLSLQPLTSEQDSPTTLFGINIPTAITNTLSQRLTATPIPFVTFSESRTSTRLSHHLTGTLKISIKDTQSVPERMTISDTLRYQHDVGGIPQWDDYKFEYIVARTTFAVQITGMLMLEQNNGAITPFTVTTQYGQNAQHKIDTLNLPEDAYRIEFPIAYTQLLDIPLLIDESEIINEAIHIFTNSLEKKLTTYFEHLTSMDLPSTCLYSPNTRPTQP